MEAQEATRLEYGPVYAAEDPTDSTSEDDETAFFNEAFTWAALIVCLAGWTVIGLFLWIPRAIRAILLFSLSLVQATVTETDLDAAGRRLRSAANFYRRGFVGAVESIRSSRDADGRSEGGWTIESSLILRETAWALFVWYLILWGAGFAILTPVDLGTLLIGLEWGALWSGIVDTAASIPAAVGR